VLKNALHIRFHPRLDTEHADPGAVQAGSVVALSSDIFNWLLPTTRRSPWSPSALRLDLTPEGLDAGVELVGDFLEGLVCLPGHDLEACARDSGGDRSTEA
jgi:hypothetical protein